MQVFLLPTWCQLQQALEGYFVSLRIHLTIGSGGCNCDCVETAQGYVAQETEIRAEAKVLRQLRIWSAW